MSGAPYSDNLYSTQDDSDDEDVLSPTDGYFRGSGTLDNATGETLLSPIGAQAPSVPNVLVEDPTLQQAAKAREAQEEARRGSAQDNEHTGQRDQGTYPLPLVDATGISSASSPFQHRRRTVGDDEDEGHPYPASPALATQFRNPRQGDAPPAYSPPIRTPGDLESGYNTFSTAAVAAPGAIAMAGETQGLLPRVPESMGGPPDGLPMSRWRRLRYASQGSNLRRTLKTILSVCLVLSIVLGLLGALSPVMNRKHTNKPEDSPSPAPQDPDRDQGPSRRLQWRQNDSCRNSPHHFSTMATTVGLGPDKDWKVEQNQQPYQHVGAGRDVLVSGEILVRPTDEIQGSVAIEVISNDSDLQVSLNMDRANEHFMIETPRDVVWPADDLAPCIQIRITMYMPRDAGFRRLGITGSLLDVSFEPGLSFQVSESVLVETGVGHVAFPAAGDEAKGTLTYAIDSRQIIITTISGSVRGAYPLYDLLKVRTVSGSVEIFVNPQEVLKDKPRPAVLDVSTSSANVAVREPIEEGIADPEAIPPRYYVTRIGTNSGSIRAAVAMTTLGSFTSDSGSIELKLLPVYDKHAAATQSGPKSKLETESHSSHTQVELREPLWTVLAPIEASRVDVEEEGYEAGQSHSPSQEGSRAFSFLDSYHHTISGSIQLKYPASWTGTIHEQSVSGHLEARGKNVVVTRKGGPAWEVLEGHAGSGSSDIKAKTISGSIDLLVGDAS